MGLSIQREQLKCRDQHGHTAYKNGAPDAQRTSHLCIGEHCEQAQRHSADPAINEMTDTSKPEQQAGQSAIPAAAQGLKAAADCQEQQQRGDGLREQTASGRNITAVVQAVPRIRRNQRCEHGAGRGGERREFQQKCGRKEASRQEHYRQIADPHKYGHQRDRLSQDKVHQRYEGVRQGLVGPNGRRSKRHFGTPKIERVFAVFDCPHHALQKGQVRDIVVSRCAADPKFRRERHRIRHQHDAQKDQGEWSFAGGISSG
jgi:hypothetical protein